MTAAEKHQKLIADLAAQAFQDHTCVQLLDAMDVRGGRWQQWECMRRQKGAQYYFHVTLRPGWLTVSGDIGYLSMSREFDILAWIKKTQHDLDNLSKKAPQCITTRDYSEDVLLESMRELRDEIIRDTDSEASAVEEEFEELESQLDDEGPDAVIRELYHRDLIDDGITCKDYTSEFLWCVEAIRWWLRAIGELT